MKVGNRSSGSRAFARLGMATIAALCVFALAAQAQADDSEPVPITTGAGLDWGVKKSFRDYIEGHIAAGVITPSEGATRNPDGTFHFPVLEGEYVPATKALSLTFAGSVHMSGHHGGLNMTVREPRVVITPEDTSLYAKVVSKPLDGSETPDEASVHFATFDVSGSEPVVDGGVTTWSAVPAAIAAGSVGPFAGHYSIGTPIDPLSFSYDGDGGKPEPSVETWTAPGSRFYDAVESWTAPAGTWRVTPVAYDAGRDLLHVGITTQSPAYSTAVQALDPETMEPIGTPTSIPGRIVDTTKHITYDAGIGAVIIWSTVSFAEKHLWQLLWNPEAETYVASEIGTIEGVEVPQDIATIRYSPAAQGLLALLGSFAPDQGMYHLYRDGTGWYYPTVQRDLESGWSGSAFPAEGRDFSTMDVLTDGSVVLAGSREGATEWDPYVTEAVVYMRDRYGVASFHPIPGTKAEILDEQWLSGGSGPPTALTQGYTRVYAGPGGRAHFVEAQSPQRVLTMRKSGWSWTKLSEGRSNLPLGTTAIVGTDGVLYTDRTGTTSPAIHEGRVIGELPFKGAMRPGPDASVYLAVGSELRRYEAVGVSPTISEHPENKAVALGAGRDSAEVTFSAAATGTPQPRLQWQTRAPGATAAKAWEDIEGETGPTLTVSVEREDGGRQYRALFSNHRTVGEVEELVGEIATDPATVTVDYAPTVAVQPTDVAALVGEDGEFKVLPTGAPYPEITWQREAGGFWTTVDPTSGNFEVDGGSLVVTDVKAAMSGAEFRARLTNSVSTTFTKEVTLTVSEPPVEHATFGGGHLDWGVKESFRKYIVGPIAHGSYEATSGATKNPDGTIRFSVYAGEYDGETAEGHIDADGEVSFIGHDSGAGPLLEMNVSNPEVEIDGETATLLVDIVSKPLAGGAPLVSDDVEVAELDAEELAPTPVTDGLAFGPAAAILTTAGSPAFAGFYTPGEELDLVSATAIFGAPQDPPPPDLPPPPPPYDPPPLPREEPPAVTPAVTKKAKKPQAKKPNAKAKKRCGKNRRAVKAKGKTRCKRKRG